MTDRPDVAALAAALDAVERPPYVPTRHIRGVLVAHRYEAAKVIAALAAQGWRITSVPEDSDEASSPASGEAKSEVVTADDPVSAQAAPDQYLDLDTYFDNISVMTADKMREKWPRSAERLEQAAVRAAIQRTAERIERLAPYGPMVDVSEVLNLLRMEVPDGE